MWRRTACIVLWLLVQQASSLRADSTQGPSLLARTPWVRFQLVLGRIEVANIPSSQTRTTTSGGEGADLFEKLTISGDTDIPSVRYERVTPTDFVSINVINGNRVEIEQLSMSSQHVVPVIFQQLPGADAVLRIGKEKETRTYRAPTLWHLLLASHDVCETHLLPLLNLMQTSWNFEDMLALATDELVREAGSSDFRTRRLARKFVRQLSDPDFAVRRYAEHNLCQLGVRVLPYLDRIPDAELNREQRQRIARVADNLRSNEADSPRRIAQWLVEDEEAWVSLLAHAELPIREIASDHLAKRFVKPIDFDPQGPAPQRTQQIARLKNRIQRY